MEIVVAGEVPMREINGGGESSRAGVIQQQRLLADDAPDGLNFVFMRNHHVHGGDSSFRTPRHNHGFQQIRFAEKGILNSAPGEDIPEGSIAYYPRGAYYGPQSREQHNITTLMQFGFGGEHQRGPVWDAYRPEALRRLRAKGTLADGLFTETDPATGRKTTRDGVQAIYEEQYRMHTQKEFVVRPTGYESPIIIHPKAFPFYDVAPGVQQKMLGRFYDQPGPDGDVRISMLRLSDGAAYQLDGSRAQVIWTVGAGVRIDGAGYPAFTGIYSRLGEDAAITGTGGVEMFLVEFPRLDPA